MEQKKPFKVCKCAARYNEFGYKKAIVNLKGNWKRNSGDLLSPLQAHNPPHPTPTKKHTSVSMESDSF